MQGLARASAGLDIDYRTARVDLFSGAQVDGLVVGSPPEFRSIARDLVRVGDIDASWSIAALFGGPAPVLKKLSVSDVALTVVVDEAGKTSFDALSGNGPAPKPAPKVPLSGQAARLLAKAAPFGEVDIDRVTATILRTQGGQVVERAGLSGVSARLRASDARPSAKGWRLRAELGSPAAPLEVRLTRARGHAEPESARAKVSLTVDVTPAELNAALDLRMLEQNLASSVSADHWLHAEARARFDPAAGLTEVTLEHAEAGDGAATCDASLGVPDTGDVLVHRARGDLDLARLLRWVPAGLVACAAERARVRYEINSLVLGSVPSLAEGGALAVDADVSGVSVGAPYGSLAVGSGELSLRAWPKKSGGGFALQGSAKVADAKLGSGVALADVQGFAAEIDGEQAPGGVLSGRVALRAALLERGGASRSTLRDGQIELRFDSLHFDSAQPLATRGDLALSVVVPSLDSRSAGVHAIVEGLAMRAHTALEGHPPFTAQVEAPIARLRVTRADGIALVDGPARVEASFTDVLPDALVPAASEGALQATLALGAVRASIDATKRADAVDFRLGASTPSLAFVRPFLSRAVVDVAPWSRMGMDLRSTGRIEGLSGGAPTIHQATVVDLDRAAYGDIVAQRLSLGLQSHGTAMRHTADVDLHAQGLVLGSGSPSDDHVTLAITVDRQSPSLQFKLATEGLAAAKVSGSLSFDPVRRALPFAIEGQVAGLAPLVPLVAKVQGADGFDLAPLGVALSAHGALFGTAVAVTRDGVVVFAPNLATTAILEGTADLRLTHFRWAKGDTGIETPALQWHGEMGGSAARRTIDNRLEVGTLHLDLGTRDVDLTGIRDDAKVGVTGSLTGPEIELTQSLSVRAVEQTVLPEYPLGDLAFSLSAIRRREGVVHISDMRLTNGLGGTALALNGNVELGDGRTTLSVTTSLAQELEKLSTIPERFKGRGKVAVEATVTSPDMTHYHVRAVVKGEDVTATLSHAGVEIDTANGEVPVTVALEVGEHGVTLERSDKGSPYSMLRFADQHPLLSRSGFLSIARLKTPFALIAPLVGNLEIEQNVVSLRQFEIGVRGGTITGQCGLDWEGPRSTLELHVRASGVQSSHGEPFDGNIAVAISAADRTIDGRAEILRIGPRHLLDLLDLQDPLHVDPAMNRVRAALAFGYPDNLRIVFDHGFASAHLQLGGLAQLVSISELRGIPMGPIVDKMLAPALAGPDTKEMP